MDQDFDGLLSHSDMAAQQQQQEELHRDIERVVELACRHLPLADQDLLRWACGVQKPEPDPRQISAWNPDGDPF